ncbi:SDR family NAD(P)-dependent oxidoreductase [Sporolactobacillus sp. CPB3-1]|uniref:SDR family NAD(P)-dependent oxidoreductase n=1 Tax=Sporolactobacillus mangiferae TaxID=2940498 RepID=A0ABT0MDW6_9BACL|nr:SDR family NAD(P)-dependent oxidoreductase [Sporolactobacillus mangiferae]MCL1632788.1 SDR family NAD(P)-dependent oxidoreductase [Sporolactobacillus mangiferae]
MNNEKRVVLITGASSGMGYASAKYFNEHGWIVYAGARRTERMKDLQDLGVRVHRLDVTDHESNQRFVEAAINKQGRIDVLINNAGYGEYGPLEEISLENARYQFDVNVFAASELAQLVLPLMRKQRFGRVINVTSVGENVFMPLGGWYHATKAALGMWSDVLDMEIRPFGLRSIVIQPGGTQSEWGKIAMQNAEKNLKTDSPYRKLVLTITKAFSSLKISATSEDLAKIFYKAATDAKPSRRYYHSLADRMMVRIAKNHPSLWRFGIEKIVNRMSR